MRDITGLVSLKSVEMFSGELFSTRTLKRVTIPYIGLAESLA